MNQLNQAPLLLASAILLVQPALAQDNLRGVVTMGFGDVAAIKQRAEAGDAKARVDLGSLLVQNFKPAEALQWYRKAAEQGNTEAAYQVGHLLLFGAVGIPNDQTVKASPAEALSWTFRAATNHHANACWDMSKALQRGLGATTNLVETYAWLQLFAETPEGSIVGRVELNTLALKLDTAAIQRAQSLVAQFKAGNWQRPAALATPESLTQLKLNGLTIGAKLSLAVINGKTVAEGESVQILFKPHPVLLKCLKIQEDSVQVAVEGEPAPRWLHLK
jgi:hypothetical protein